MSLMTTSYTVSDNKCPRRQIESKSVITAIIIGWLYCVFPVQCRLVWNLHHDFCGGMENRFVPFLVLNPIPVSIWDSPQKKSPSGGYVTCIKFWSACLVYTSGKGLTYLIWIILHYIHLCAIKNWKKMEENSQVFSQKSGKNSAWISRWKIPGPMLFFPWFKFLNKFYLFIINVI